jgi:hypothetical protein
VVAAARRAKAVVSITVRQTRHIKAVISTIGDDAWTTIKYPKAVFDEPSGRWISRAEVAEIPFVAFKSRKKSEQVPGRLVVRRIPDLNPKAVAGQPALFDSWRFHAFFTTSVLDTVTADKTHRGHAIIEQVHADLKDSALAHLPCLILSQKPRRPPDLRECVVDGFHDGCEGVRDHEQVTCEILFVGVSRSVV